ncbi:Ribosome-releasing factor 2, mitochondrial [Neophaeococcomyces mojaviensis]|uniref:Ribosome-releasing factor 2, mitochondrial n=1 Tax=Neophaeococcomyces mojaviensis TaxID=3383035 RepID=A0ACC3AIS2_9EURO|nr:Ribosome-releasing factor 2, mitochondrial [Knufia sp. JES_112]
MIFRHGLLQRHSCAIRSLKATKPWISPLRCRFASQLPSGDEQTLSDTDRTRNIGIIAHIDAGKTTTTERMLYYSGHTRRIGDVDEGSTVTDFLPAERARGITIQSAAITFNWPPQPDSAEDSTILEAVQKHQRPRSALSHRINLIDTPGHADFTFEVRRSLRILDGAVCVLDGVAGVEAQTEQVWNQAAEWRIPRIAYVNKLDRDGAVFGQTVREIGVRLGGWPAVCQIPWFEGGRGGFCGVADVLTLSGLKYEPGGDGKSITRLSLEQLESAEPTLAAELKKARIALVEILSEHDENMIEIFLEAEEDHLAITSTQLLDSMRRSLMSGSGKLIPVFAGASFRNIGIQPLLDAVNDLLPSPLERPQAEVSIGETTGTLSELLEGKMLANKSSLSKQGKKGETTVPAMQKTLKGCALAFKVVNDPRKGVLVYIRVYSGTIDRNALLFNTNLKQSERATTLFRMYANQSVPVDTIEAGQIGVIAGSKFARTGDTLISCYGNRTTPPQPLDRLQLRPIQVPPPVFFASIEPNSLKDERDMHDKLNLLLREDPSLHVSQDEDTGQTLLSGMGELHLEIARDRLVGDLKAHANMGKIAIGYRETLTQASSPNTKIFDSSARGDAKGKAGCTAKVEPLAHEAHEGDYDENALRHEQDGNVVIVTAPSLDKKGRPLSDDAISLPGHLSLNEVQSAFTNGALAALARGPAYSYPLRGVKATLIIDPAKHIFGGDTSYSALTAAARLATISAFREVSSAGASALMEPVMNVDISVDDASIGNIIQDISSSRGGQIVSLGDNEEAEANEQATALEIDVNRIYAPKDPFEFGTSATLDQQINKQRSIKAKVPLKEMVGYLKHLRSMTGGRGTFTMSVDRFERMTGQREKALIAELRGGA